MSEQLALPQCQCGHIQRQHARVLWLEKDADGNTILHEEWLGQCERCECEAFKRQREFLKRVFGVLAHWVDPGCAGQQRSDAVVISTLLPEHPAEQG